LAELVRALNDITAVPCVDTSLLTTTTSTVSEDGDMPALRLLVFVQQRHPLIVQEAADEISRADTDIQERVDSVVTSLSLAVAPPPSASASEAGVGSLVASMSADEHARTAAVKELLASA
jgi:hypothetical protein